MVARQLDPQDWRLPARRPGAHGHPQQIKPGFVAPRRWRPTPARVFFKRRPALLRPLLDGLFIALARPFDRLLAAPAYLPHQSINVVAVITHSKRPGDDLGDAFRRPDISTKPIRFGSRGLTAQGSALSVPRLTAASLL
jgi:hypothetical protein